MSQKKRTFARELNTVSGLKLQPRPAGEEDFEARLPASRKKRGQPFSREVVLRLIDHLKQD